MLQRIVEAMRDNAIDDRWEISGEILEFFDQNRLLIRTARASQFRLTGLLNRRRVSPPDSLGSPPGTGGRHTSAAELRLYAWERRADGSEADEFTAVTSPIGTLKTASGEATR